MPTRAEQAQRTRAAVLATAAGSSPRAGSRHVAAADRRHDGVTEGQRLLLLPHQGESPAPSSTTGWRASTSSSTWPRPSPNCTNGVNWWSAASCVGVRSRTAPSQRSRSATPASGAYPPSPPGWEENELATRTLHVLFGPEPTPDEQAAFWMMNDLSPVTRRLTHLPDDELAALLRRMCLRLLPGGQ